MGLRTRIKVDLHDEPNIRLYALALIALARQLEEEGIEEEELRRVLGEEPDQPSGEHDDD